MIYVDFMSILGRFYIDLCWFYVDFMLIYVDSMLIHVDFMLIYVDSVWILCWFMSTKGAPSEPPESP